jgi:hypothetical protein
MKHPLAARPPSLTISEPIGPLMSPPLAAHSRMLCIAPLSAAYNKAAASDVGADEVILETVGQQRRSTTGPVNAGCSQPACIKIDNKQTKRQFRLLGGQCSSKDAVASGKVQVRLSAFGFRLSSAFLCAA